MTKPVVLAEGYGDGGAGLPWRLSLHEVDGLQVRVGGKETGLLGAERDRFAEAVARACTAGQVSDGG